MDSNSKVCALIVRKMAPTAKCILCIILSLFSLCSKTKIMHLTLASPRNCDLVFIFDKLRSCSPGLTVAVISGVAVILNTKGIEV